jgi:hypothetical protein
MPFRGSITLAPNVVTGYIPGSHLFEPYKSGMTFGWVKIDAPSAERAEGGYYRLKATIKGPRLFLADLFGMCLTRHVEVFSSQDLKVWQGFVFEAVLHLDNIDMRISMDRVTNGVWMRYRVIGSPTTVRSTEQIDTPSRNQFGIIQHVLGGGELASSNVADTKCQQYLEWNRQPKPTKVGDGSEQSLELSCYGYFDTLDWQAYNQTAITGTQGSSSEAADIIAAKGQFVKSTKIDGNSLAVARVYDTDRTPKGILTDLGKLGDPLQNRFLPRMMDDRLFMFVQAAPSKVNI